MKIISYKYFSNPLDFELWQQQDKPEIVSVTPVTNRGELTNDIDHANNYAIAGSSFQYSQVIFVTFLKEGSL